MKQLTDQEIEQAFYNTNYGANPNFKAIIFDTLLKLYLGFGTGKTSICICKELYLLNSKGKPNKKGINFMRDNYSLTGLR